MKNRRLILPLIALSLGLAACGDTETDMGTETPTEDSSEENGSSNDSATSGVNDDEAIPTEGEATDPDYALLEQAKEEYYSGDLNAAEETLNQLLENDLSDKELLEAEAEDLLEEISQQLEESDAGDASAIADLNFVNERQSMIMHEEYEAATGQPLSKATDEQLETWLAQQEVQKSHPAKGEEASESETPDPSSMTEEEAENYAFEQVLERAEVQDENYFYFVNHSEEDWVQVEVRETATQGDVIFSNLIGMYRYNLETDEIKELNINTGEYRTVNE